jgi:hypothetical protein
MGESSDLERQSLWKGHNEAGGKPFRLGSAIAACNCLVVRTLSVFTMLLTTPVVNLLRRVRCPIAVCLAECIGALVLGAICHEVPQCLEALSQTNV